MKKKQAVKKPVKRAEKKPETQPEPPAVEPIVSEAEPVTASPESGDGRSAMDGKRPD